MKHRRNAEGFRFFHACPRQTRTGLAGLGTRSINQEGAIALRPSGKRQDVYDSLSYRRSLRLIPPCSSTVRSIAQLSEYMALVRLLQPTLVVIEDIDLVAKERVQERHIVRGTAVEPVVE